MKFVLQLFDVKTNSIASLRLDDRDRLLNIWTKVKDSTVFSNIIYFFGSGDKLSPISGVDQLVKAFAKEKPESYSFADVRNLMTESPHYHWTVGIRRSLVTVSLACESELEKVAVLVDELVSFDGKLVEELDGSEVDSPFSFLEVPGTQFVLTRPPRFFGRISRMSIVDVIYLKAQVPEDVRQLFNQLRNVKTIRGAHRTIKDDLLIVKWGDPLQESLKSILERRYAWYAEHGSLPIDSSFNLMGDKEFALTDAEPVAGLTAYSALTKKGMKAIVFDLPDEAVGVLQDVQRMVIAGETAEGYPLREVTLVVPSREEALDLHPIARQYDVQVAYVGDDDRLWNPFPPEYGSS